MQCVAQCLAHSTVVFSSPQMVSESRFGGLRLPSGKTSSKGRSLEDRPGGSYTAPYPLALEPQLASDQGHGEPVHQPPAWGEASTGSPSQGAQGSQQASVEALVELLCRKPRQSSGTRTGEKRREAVPRRACEYGAKRAEWPLYLG